MSDQSLIQNHYQKNMENREGSQIKYKLEGKANFGTKVGPFFIVHRGSWKTQLIQKKSKVWTFRENVRFWAFCELYGQRMKGTGLRERWRFFERMSQFVGTRNVNQCRSYFGRVGREFKNSEEFQIFLERDFPQIVEQMNSSLEELKRTSEFQHILKSKSQNITVKEEASGPTNPTTPKQAATELTSRGCFSGEAAWNTDSYMTSMPEHLFTYFYPDLPPLEDAYGIPRHQQNAKPGSSSHCEQAHGKD